MEVNVTEQKTDWHDIFYSVLEDLENLRELSGKIIAGKAREYEQQIRIDFVIHSQGDIPQEQLKPIVRPFSHFPRKKESCRIQIDLGSTQRKMFRRYLGRVLDAETTDDVDYRGETTLTILTLHKPKLLLVEKAYKIERITDWMYRSF